MILIDTVGISFLFVTILLKGITTVSFSNVYVQSKPEEYLQYGPPSSSNTGQKFAQISTAPNVIPLKSVQELVSPCLAPCVIPGTTIPAVAPQTRTSIITYKSPLANIPIALSNKDATTSYQYSYAIYDEHTGDHKTPSEHSDVSAVRGLYTLIEPNGGRREVIYTADDLKGFNAVVRNILSEPKVIKNKPKESEEKEVTPSCNEVKNEQLKEPKKDDKMDEEFKNDNDVHNVKQSNAETTEGIETTPVEVIKMDEITAEQPEKLEDIPKTPELSENNNEPFSDIIKCLHAKLHGTYSYIENHRHINPSPLTYIILPTFDTNPC